MPESELYNTILELQESGRISARAGNACRHNLIRTLKELLDFYEQNGDFLLLHNMGAKTNQELIEFCESPSKHKKMGNSKKPHFLVDAYANLSPTEKQIFDNSVEKLRYSLSTRSIRILEVLCPEFTSENIIKYFSSINFEFGRVRNSGAKTTVELEHFTEKLVSFIQHAKSFGLEEKLPDEPGLPEVVDEILFENFYLKLKEVTGKCDAPLINFLKLHFKEIKAEDFPVLKCLEMCLLHSSLVKERDRRLINIKTQYIPTTENLAALTEAYGLSKERVRQLTIDLGVEKNYWRPIKMFFHHLHDIGLSNNAILIDGLGDDVVFLNEKEINEQYGTNFSQSFLTIAASKFSDNYTARSTKKTHQYFLIRQDLDEQIDIPNLLLKAEDYIYKAVPVAASYSLLAFMKPFLVAGIYYPEALKRLEAAIAVILDGLYGLKTDEKGNLQIIRNTKKRVWEYIEAVLKEEGKPLHVNEISRRLIAQGRDLSPGNVRAQTLQAHSVFALAGLSTYGLRTWKNEGRFLEGTIKNIIVKYLKDHPRPVHLFEIFRHMRPYRDTNLRSIIGIVQLDPHGLFRSFGQLFYGLNDQDYSATNTSFHHIGRHWFNAVKLRFFEGNNSSVSLQSLVDYVAKRYNVAPIQVEHVLDQRLEEQEISIDEDNMVRLVSPKEIS